MNRRLVSRERNGQIDKGRLEKVGRDPARTQVGLAYNLFGCAI